MESLKQGRAERQKLIKIADRSELADNSDDEKRMVKAEKAAEKKVARKRKMTLGGDSSRGGKRPQFQQPRPQQTTNSYWYS